MMFWKKESKKAPPFSSYSVSVQLAGIIASIGAFCVVVLLAATVGWMELPRLAGFFLGLWSGGRSSWLVSGRLSVFFHELKHAVMCSLAGNKAKGMRYGEEEGEFEYEYSKSKRSLNLLIVTAPYWFPLFAVPISIFLPVFGVLPGDRLYALLIGWAYGVDRRLGQNDIHPGQTDLLSVPGGYEAGVFYLKSLDYLVMSLLVLLCVFDWRYAETLLRKIDYAL